MKMKFTKKIATILLSVCLIVPCFSVMALAANGVIFFSDLETSVGDEFTITGTAVVSGEHFVITKGMDGCLFLYPDNEWKAFEEKLRTLPLTNKKARDFKRFFLGSATEGELDKQGRVLISSSLRAYADLEKEVVLAGVLDKVEIWSKEAWEARTADVEENIEDIASDMEDLGLSI